VLTFRKNLLLPSSRWRVNCAYPRRQCSQHFATPIWRTSNLITAKPKIYYFHNDITEVLYNAWPKSVAARSKACACSRSLAGIAVSNPAWGMNICLRINVVCHQGKGSVTGRSPVHRSPTKGVCVCVIRCNNNITPKMKRHRRREWVRKTIPSFQY